MGAAACQRLTAGQGQPGSGLGQDHRFGKLNVRHGKGSRRRGPKPRLVPLINGADRNRND